MRGAGFRAFVAWVAVTACGGGEGAPVVPDGGTGAPDAGATPAADAGPRGSVVQNSMTTNALTKNALTKNALTKNALTKNALTKNALTRDALLASALAEDPLARELLSYLYSCAMPAGAELHLIIDGADLGTYQGALGLAPGWGVDGGMCDQSCQRWVSACLLARTNFFGIPVDVSLRGAHPALAPLPAELGEFTVREAGYYGNLFGEVTGASDCSVTPCVCVPDAESSPMLACAADGVGDGYLEQRVCAGGVDVCGFDVRGPCETSCDGAQADGAYLGCWRKPYCSGAPTLTFDETITVFLRPPVLACGNGVCDAGESSALCPRDCLPGWAIHPGQQSGTLHVADADVDGAGDVAVAASAVFGGVDFGSGPVTGLGTVLAVLDDTGAQRWAAAKVQFGLTSMGGPRLSVAADGAGGLYLAGSNGNGFLRLDGSFMHVGGVLAHYGPAGARDLTSTFTLAPLDRITDVARAADGDVLIAGDAASPLTIAGVALDPGGTRRLWAARFAPDGSLRWAKLYIPTAGAGEVRTGEQRAVLATQDHVVVIDGDGALLLAVVTSGAPPAAALAPGGDLVMVEHTATGVRLRRDGGLGELRWSRELTLAASEARVVVGPDGAIHFACSFTGSVDVAGAQLTALGNPDVLLVELDGDDGSPRWAWRFGDPRVDQLAALAAGGGGHVLLATHYFFGIEDLSLGGAQVVGAGARGTFLVELPRVAPYLSPATDRLR